MVFVCIIVVFLTECFCGKNIFRNFFKCHWMMLSEISKLSLKNLIYNVHTRSTKNDKNCRTESQQCTIYSNWTTVVVRCGAVFKVLHSVFRSLSSLWSSLKTEESRVGSDFPSLRSHLLLSVLLETAVSFHW